MSTLQTIEQELIVPIIRTDEKEKLQNIVAALHNGGARVLEVSMNTPGMLSTIEWVRINYPDILIGAGTIIDEASARLAVLSGAEFLLTPSLDTSVIEMGNQYNIPVIPGVYTPTEVVAAMRAGAEMVKVFPARSLGVTYIKDLKGPLPKVRAMAVGGISIKNAREYIDNGWNALGIGSHIVDNVAINRGDFTQLTTNMREIKNALFRGNKNEYSCN